MGIFLVLYLAVAAINYSVVQSVLGSVAGDYFSREWGGEVRIGSLHAMLWDHVVADNLLMVAPNGDTILDAGRLSVRFDKIPYSGGDLDEGGRNTGTLAFKRVLLRDAYYHLDIHKDGATGKSKLNLDHIISYYSKGARSGKRRDRTFTVDVGTLVLNRVHYKMDLPDNGNQKYDYGVQIPHMEFWDINGRFRDIHVVNEDVSVRILKMSTRERSGFVVDNISGNVHVGRYDITVKDLDVETPKSHIMADTKMEYPNWMPDYLHTVQHNLLLKEGTVVAFTDVAYWAPVLWNIDVTLKVNGSAWGSIDSLVTDGLSVHYGDGTDLYVSGNVVGLPDIAITDFDIERLDFRTIRSDIEDIDKGIPYISHSLASRMSVADYVDLQCVVNGGYERGADVCVELTSGLGDIRSDIRMSCANGGQRHVWIDACSENLDLGWTGVEWISQAGVDVSLEAVMPQTFGDSKRWTVDADIVVPHSYVCGNRLSEVNVEAHLKDGLIRCLAWAEDSLLDFKSDVTVDCRDSVPIYVADVVVDKFAAKSFGLSKSGFADVAGRISATARGTEMDNINASLIVSNIKVDDMVLDDVRLDMDSYDSYKDVRIDCVPVKLNLSGEFSYADLPLIVQHVVGEIVPSDVALMSPIDSLQLRRIASDRIDFGLQWNDDGRLTNLLTKGTYIAKGSRISGTYNNREMLKVAMRSDSIRVGSVLLSDLGLSGKMKDDDFIVDVALEDIIIGKLNAMSAVDISIKSSRDCITAGVVWGDKYERTKGDVAVAMKDGRVDLLRPYFYIGETIWTLGVDSLSVARNDGFNVLGNGISISSGNQRVSANISVCGKESDSFKIVFDEFDLKPFCSLFLDGNAFMVEGEAGGYFEMYGLGKIPYFNANIQVGNCRINDNEIGNMSIRSNWNAELNTLNLLLNSDQLDAHGWIGLSNADPDVSFTMAADGLDISMGAPMLKNISSQFEGKLYGDWDISGNMSSPVVQGEAVVKNGVVKLDMTGVRYKFDDSIYFEGTTLSMKHFRLVDPYGNVASLDGFVNFENVNDIVFDISLNTDNLLVFDKPYDEQLYGTLFATAEGKVSGSVDNISVSLVAHPKVGSTIIVPVNNQRRIKTQSYISFVGDTYGNADVYDKGINNKTLDLQVDLDITPDVKINIPMDFSEFTVNIGANGNGNMHIGMNGGHPPVVLGNYEITSGTMQVGFLSIVKRDFNIEQGSNLNFQGSVPDTRFDIKAVYSQRANLSTLTGSLSSIDNTQKYIQVENVIAVSGTLNEPTIGFDLRLPNSDQSVEDEVFTYIDRNSENDMLNQTLSLLVNGNFYASDYGDASTSVNMASSGINTLASTLGGMVADMVDVVNINVDYKVATESTNQQLDFNISKDWGRWYLESTLGYGGDGRSYNTTNVNGAIVDALVGYRISPLVHIFAYNRTNTNDYTRMDLPYRQGIGLKLTKDFDRWSDIFRTTKKK